MENKIPQQVGALRVHKAGSIPVLEAVQLPPVNQLHDTDILVKIQATGITHFDLFLMTGKIPMPVKFPYIPGSDCVGRVIFAGKAAQPLIGKRIILVGAQGTWSEYIPFNMNGVIPIADDVPVGSAAYGFSNPLTAIGLLSYIKNQKRKGIVLDAAASALGKMINRLARKEKIPVINVVRKKEHEESLKKQGFQNVIVTEGDWKPKYDALVKSSGVDTLIDSLGSGDVLSKLIHGLPAGGRVLVISTLDGGKPIVDFGNPKKVEADKYSIEPWILTNWFMNISGEDKKKIGQIHSDRLKTDLATNISASFKFKDIAKAIEAANSNNFKGKILLVP